MAPKINAVHIIHQDGIPIISSRLSVHKASEVKSFEDLFGGFSSAINSLIQQLGHKELRSIEVENGILVYSFKKPIIFVVFADSLASEYFAKILVKQIEYEFFQEYGELLMQDDAYIRGERYLGFKSTINTLYEQMLQIDSKFPRLLEFLPAFIPLHYIYVVVNLGEDIIRKYPHATIKLVRDLPLYFEDNIEIQHLVERTIGRYAGFHIIERMGDETIIMDQKNISKLLNEISVCKYDKKHDAFNIILCPICRGRTSDRPMCDFFSGFIEGALRNPSMQVEEVRCKARGDEFCRFQLSRK